MTTRRNGLDLLVDGGQTATRLALARDGDVVATATAPGFSYHTLNPDGDILTGLDRETSRLLSADGQIETVCAGLTGLPPKGPERTALATAIREGFDARRALVTSDAVIAHVGALRTPGVVTVAGTGAITIGVHGDGRTVQVDGWGYMLGDAGGGYWIGRRALDQVLRNLDGRYFRESLLTELALKRFGPLENLARRVTESEDRVAQTAKFTVEVAEAARSGDELAVGIWREAVGQLASSVGTAISHLFEGESVAVSWAGNLFAVKDLLLEPLIARITEQAPLATVTRPRGAPLSGAMLLVDEGSDSPWADLITEVTR